MQILLGPQLWHYWLVHTITSYNTLVIERNMECTLPLKIIADQKLLISNVLSLINKETDFKQIQSQITISFFNILTAYKEAINSTSETFLYPFSNTNKGDSNTQNNDNIASCVNYVINNLQAVNQTTLGQECETIILLISEIETKMEKNIKDILSNVEGNYLANKVISWSRTINDYIKDENFLKILDYMPKNQYLNRLNQVLPFFQWAFARIEGIAGQKIDALENISSQINQIHNELDTIEAKKNQLDEKLGNACKELKESAINQMMNTQALDKSFTYTMYKKLLDNYLKRAKGDIDNLLYSDIQQKGSWTRVKEIILNQVEKIPLNILSDLLNHAIQNQECKIEVITFLLLNLASISHFKRDVVPNHEKIKDLFEQSTHSIMDK